MKIAVWRTGHEIADRVAESLTKGIPNAVVKTCYSDTVQLANAHIGYGILRGSGDIFRCAETQRVPWFNVDRGYFKPRHYDGYYRISYRGTQQTFDWPEPDYERLERLKLGTKSWRGFAPEKPVLVVPPTEHVRKFFAYAYWGLNLPDNHVIRIKGDTSPIRFEDYNYVLTFNSSVGWQALQAGIPCVADPTNSIVGSWFNNISLDQLADKQLQYRNKLFATMAASQFTLQEIEQGKAWSLIKHYTYGSATMTGKLSPLKLPPTPSANGLKARFQSNI